jgi:hypothetical protein
LGPRTLSYHASGQLEDEIYSAGLVRGLSVERDDDSLSRLATISSANGSPLTAYSYAASRLHTGTQGDQTKTESG